MSQASSKLSEPMKERVRYLAALTHTTQAEIVNRSVSQYAERHADEIATGLERARAVLALDDATIAAYLLDEPIEAVERIAGKHPASTPSTCCTRTR